MKRIEEIRSSTIRVIFLLLGAHELGEAERIQLGLPDLSMFDDYYRICEYINYHSEELYIVDFGNGDEYWGFSVPDPYSQVVEGRYSVYSGFYLRTLRTGMVRRFQKENMPKTIWLGNLAIENTELVEITPKKVVKLFENGHYVGPILVEEDCLDY